MTDENPKSLLFLCDDTIRDILSFMPIKSRVRLSRTCTALYKVVEESLLGVHTLWDHKWFMEQMDESKMKTSSKMRNLRTVHAVLLTESDTDYLPAVKNWMDVVSVMVENCPDLEHIEDWDMRCVDAYVTGLHAKGLPVRLKTVRPWNLVEGWGHLLSVLEKSLSNLILDIDCINDPSMKWTPSSRSRVTKLFGYEDLPVAQILMFSNVRELGVVITGEDRLQLILDSMPHLNHIGILIEGQADGVLQLLTEAKQQFVGLHFYCYSRVPLSELKIQLLLEKKGRKLRDLCLNFKCRGFQDSPIDLIEVIRKCCPSLKSFGLELTSCRRSEPRRSINYVRRELEIHSYDNLKPLLTLLPHAKEFSFSDSTFCRGTSFLTDGQLQESVMTELRNYAATKKRHAVHVVVHSKDYANKTRILLNPLTS